MYLDFPYLKYYFFREKMICLSLFAQRVGKFSDSWNVIKKQIFALILNEADRKEVSVLPF